MKKNRPVCPKHNRQMVAYASGATHTFYRCPECGKKAAEKKAKPTR